MIEISTRYLGAALALILLALIPVGLHSYAGMDDDDCADAVAMLDAGQIPGSFDVRERSNARRGNWLQWTRGRVDPSGPGVEPMEFRIVRSMKPRRIYLRPTSFLGRKLEPDEVELGWLESDGVKLPVYTGTVFHYAKGALQVASWMYVYEGRPVAHPFRAQMATALPQLFSGTRSLTLFLISGYAPRRRIELVSDPAGEWLAAAWRRYQSVCLE